MNLSSAKMLWSAITVGLLSRGISLVPMHLRIARSHRLTTGVRTPILLSFSEQSRLRLASKEDEDDETGEDPLANGVESVSWLPSVLTSSPGSEDLTQDESEMLPLFPLGGIVYTPNSEHVLNIFEPRYRKLYNDILMNGTRRFVVSMSHPSVGGSFARMGVLFELEDLKEVSEQTEDQIKYICNHKVTGRVKIHRVINPQDWESRETYLRVEATIIDDSGKDGKDEDSDATDNVYGIVRYTKEEKALKDAFGDLVDIQHELEEDVRFTKVSVLTLAVKPGAGDNGLWQTIRLWQSFADQRLMARQNELQRDFQIKLQEFLKKEKGLDEEQLPSAVGFDDLSEALKQEVQELQKRMSIELKPLVLESTLTMQKVLEGKDHLDRLHLVRHFVESETRRLKMKKTLQGVFSGEAVLDEEPIVAKESPATKANTQPSSYFNDEEDAFQ